MKSNSDIRPAVIQNLGNGAYYYNFNIVEVEKKSVPSGDSDEETVATSPGVTYNYDTVKVWGTPTYDKLVKAVIREEIDETKEFGYVNDYNAAKEGIIEDEAEAAEAVAAYKEYLQFVRDVKAQVKADLRNAEY